MNGILNVYKEAGFTSHDVVAKLRGILRQKKIGHTGTLDPAATGVLPVCCGKATKVCGLLTDKDKSYRAVCRLGVETDTQDMTGQVLSTGDYNGITDLQIRNAVSLFQGEILQIPPMYSALKINGRKLYELAREGVTVERKPRPVTIHQVNVTEFALDQGLFTMEVTCSKGTYIRTLCHDIGTRLGCKAAMESLVRTRVADFDIRQAVTLNQIEQIAKENPEQLEELFYSVDSLFPDYPKGQIKQKFAPKLANGNPLLPEFLQEHSETERILSPGDNILIYDENGDFKAVYQKGETDLRVYKMF